MEEHVAGTCIDPVVDFHTGYGAKFISIVPDYRPEDHENQGIGILIHYHLQTVLAPPIISKRPSLPVEKSPTEGGVVVQKVKTINLIAPILEDNAIEVNEETMGLSLFSHGMDSLELVQLKNKISSDLGIDLPSTFLLDYPTLEQVCARLDDMRGVNAKVETQAENSDG